MNPRPLARDIIAEVARRHGITVDAMTGPKRYPDYVAARWEAMSIIRKELGYSFPRIGALFNRDHASVIYALRGGRPISDEQRQERQQRYAEQNASRVKGVYWHTQARKWIATITIAGRCIHLGVFTDYEAAVARRRQAEAQPHHEVAA